MIHKGQASEPARTATRASASEAVYKALLVCVAAAGCGRSRAVPDDQIGGLVVEPKPAAKIDVERAVREPDELSRALASTHGTLLAALGPHSLTIEARTVVEEAGKPVSDLGEHTVLELGDAGSFHGLYTNTADYGREAIYLAADNQLYLRPRYQRWHVRAPETADEPAQIRDKFFAAIAATWELVAPGAELTARDGAPIAGRATRRIEVKLAPTPRPNPREELVQRRWRETRAVRSLTGEVLLDADTGLPLAAKLSGSVEFARDDRRFVMRLELDAKVTRLGAVAIAAPTEDVVATPERNREVDERDFLLHGIAPPIRKNADGTAAAPALPSNGSAAAKGTSGARGSAADTGSGARP